MMRHKVGDTEVFRLRRKNWEALHSTMLEQFTLSEPGLATNFTWSFDTSRTEWIYPKFFLFREIVRIRDPEALEIGSTFEKRLLEFGHAMGATNTYFRREFSIASGPRGLEHHLICEATAAFVRERRRLPAKNRYQQLRRVRQ